MYSEMVTTGSGAGAEVEVGAGVEMTLELAFVDEDLVDVVFVEVVFVLVFLLEEDFEDVFEDEEGIDEEELCASEVEDEGSTAAATVVGDDTSGSLPGLTSFGFARVGSGLRTSFRGSEVA